MKIYTKGGDKGLTSLIGGERAPKDDPRVEAYGTLDELVAQTAFFCDTLVEHGVNEYTPMLNQILSDLMTIEALAAKGNKGNTDKLHDIATDKTALLERMIDEFTQAVEPIDKFTIPGGSTTVSLCHVCRTVCRRAERRMISASIEYQEAMKYINRLSDLFYALGRKLTSELHVVEKLWIP